MESFEKNTRREGGGGVATSQGGSCCRVGWGLWGGSWNEECCSVIDFRVVVLQCYCCDAAQIKSSELHRQLIRSHLQSLLLKGQS